VNILRLPVGAGVLDMIDPSRISMDQLYVDQIRPQELDSFVYNVQSI